MSNAGEYGYEVFFERANGSFSCVAHDFPRNLWDLLLPQTEVILNLILQATLDPYRSALEYFHGPLNDENTPLGPLGCNIINHKKAGTRNSWDFRGTANWNVGVALQHYWCHKIISKTTKADQVSDTVEFIHHHLTLADITPMYRIFHGVTTLMCAFETPPPLHVTINFQK